MTVPRDTRSSQGDGRVKSGVNKMSKEDDIRDVLNQAVKIIAGVQSNPRTWQSWLVYFLTQLEAEASKGSSANIDSFTEMLSALQDAIRNRARTGGWN
ncbi:MAG: hypothetical protein HY258_03950 [Chloroflexi bacterium]|nr:hypothetical protein [Chloroflexota bacterium]